MGWLHGVPANKAGGSVKPRGSCQGGHPLRWCLGKDLREDHYSKSVMKKVSGLCLGKEHFRAGEWEAMCGGTRRYGLEARSRGARHSSDTDDPGKPGQATSATGFHDPYNPSLL